MTTQASSASPLDIPVGQRFRLLTPGERIQRGDECLNDDCETWSKVSVIVLRCDYNPMVFVPHRRQMLEAAWALNLDIEGIRQHCTNRYKEMLEAARSEMAKEKS